MRARDHDRSHIVQEEQRVVDGVGLGTRQNGDDFGYPVGGGKQLGSAPLDCNADGFSLHQVQLARLAPQKPFEGNTGVYHELQGRSSQRQRSSLRGRSLVSATALCLAPSIREAPGVLA